MADVLLYRLGRVMCRFLRRHNASCRGRLDHIRAGKIIELERWVRWP